MCTHAGVDAIGLNLWPKSRRALSQEQARQLCAAWPTPGPLRIGVFVDPEIHELQTMVRDLHLDAVQLHGNQSIEAYANLGIPYIWVIRGTPPIDSLQMPSPSPQWVLLDSQVAGYGGMGETTDWSWAKQIVERWMQQAKDCVPVWLAGGLHPENAAQAIAQVHPAGLDVASGSENANPRQKESSKVQALVEICKHTS